METGTIGEYDSMGILFEKNSFFAIVSVPCNYIDSLVAFRVSYFCRPKVVPIRVINKLRHTCIKFHSLAFPSSFAAQPLHQCDRMVVRIVVPERFPGGVKEVLAIDE